MYISDQKNTKASVLTGFVSVCPDRAGVYVRPTSVVNDDTTVLICNGERAHWFYLGLCARHTCNFIFQQSIRILSAMPNIFLLMN